MLTLKLVLDFPVSFNSGTAQCLSNNLRCWQHCVLIVLCTTLLNNLTSEWYLRTKNKQLKPPKIKTDLLASSAIIYCPNMIINMSIFYTSVKAFMYLCSKTHYGFHPKKLILMVSGNCHFIPDFSLKYEHWL